MDNFGLSLNRILAQITRWGALLVLPLVTLLFAQWPLRDWIGAGSRQANDLAQWIFALYVAFAIQHTSRIGAHLSADAFAARYSDRVGAVLRRYGQAVCVLPWTIFVLVSASAPVWRSVMTLEAFPDTSNPFYFVIKGSVWLLALLMAVQSLSDVLTSAGSRDTRSD